MLAALRNIRRIRLVTGLTLPLLAGYGYLRRAA